MFPFQFGSISDLMSTKQSGGAPDKRLAEMQRTLDVAERELEKAKEESGRSAAETERLLKLVQMTQEEQNSKEKQIRDLQEWVAPRLRQRRDEMFSLVDIFCYFIIKRKHNSQVDPITRCKLMPLISPSQSTQNRTSQAETSYNCTARGQYTSRYSQLSNHIR